ncbi:hypothetical protein ACFY9A_08365 [Streptomyces rubradiris]|uniref:hypothetical protein n=1 Tax=Streptomyces rubradiris TaxID=285531 RepID=UPI0036EBBBAD
MIDEHHGLLVLLDDADPRIRTRIAYLLAWFPEVAATTLPLLLARTAREDDPVVAATALVAAGLIGTAALAADFDPYLDAEEPLTRWAAATALVRITSDREGAVLSQRTVPRAVAAPPAGLRRPPGPAAPVAPRPGGTAPSLDRPLGGGHARRARPARTAATCRGRS